MKLSKQPSLLVKTIRCYANQFVDFVSGLHNCLEFSQPLSRLYQAMQTRKTFNFLLLKW